MVKVYEMQLEKLPDPENIQIVHATNLNAIKYISSLKSALQWKITEIKGEISYSRSGKSAYIDKIYIKAETNAHIHEVYIYEVYGNYKEHSIPLPLSDWYMDGKEMGIVVLPKFIMSRIRSIVEAMVKAGYIDDYEFDIQLKQCRVLAPGDWY